MRVYVDAVWGWNDAWQRAAHDRSYPAVGLYVIAKDATDVGVVQYEQRDGAMWIGRLEVLPAFQSRGLGAAVIVRVAHSIR